MSAPNVKLYYSPGACSLAPHVLLEEVGEPFDVEQVLVSEGETTSPAHIARNPKGRVPVLEIDGAFLTEVPAISLWISNRRPDLDLFPEDAWRAARALEWFNWLSGSLHSAAFSALWRPQRFVDAPELFAPVMEKGRGNVGAAFEVIERQLANRIWAVPPSYSAVDPYLLVFYRWGNRIGLDMRRYYPFWSSHAELIAARPSVQRVLAREKVSIWTN
jgi:glutathione S-transferase